MPSLREKRASLVKEMAGLTDRVKSADMEAIKRVDELASEIDEIDGKIQSADAAKSKINAFGTTGTSHTKGVNNMTIKSLGNAMADALKEKGATRGVSFTTITADVKAANDTAVSPTRTEGDLTDRIVFPAQRQLRVRDLFAAETVSSPAVSYFVAGATEGAPAKTAENGKKPQFHIGATVKTVALSKIAGIMKESDELLEDYPRLASAIDGRGKYELDLVIENDLINGDGQNGNVAGILSVDGIQSGEYKKAATPADIAEAVYDAITKVQLNSGYNADGIVINPADYQKIRLYKDSNGQYFGGGYFTGAYGNGVNVVAQPELWGVPTVVTPAIPAGTILVGNFAAGASVMSKGGQSAATGYDGEDFSHNRVTVRVEERLALATYVPQAFFKLTQAAN